MLLEKGNTLKTWQELGVPTAFHRSAQGPPLIQNTEAGRWQWGQGQMSQCLQGEVLHPGVLHDAAPPSQGCSVELLGW